MSIHQTGHRHRWHLARAALALRLLASAALFQAATSAVPAYANGGDPCSGRTTVVLKVSASSITLGQPITVDWDFAAPAGCEVASLRMRYRDATSGILVHSTLSGQIIQTSGSAIDQPQSSGRYFVEARVNGTTMELGSAPVSVTLPTLNGRTTVDITRPDQNGLFAQAIAANNALVQIDGTLDLDLSNMADLRIGKDVQIQGDRTVVRSGPRLFTTTFPDTLLEINQDNVHISGIRLDGGESDDPFSAVDQPDSFGIRVDSSNKVEIDHSELMRWRGAAVTVRDGNGDNKAELAPGRIHRTNADTVNVHDNFIHHNQHPTDDVCTTGIGLALGFILGGPAGAIAGGAAAAALGPSHGAGYGVEAADGAYVTIQRNVFDWNRHAIAADGKQGTGYIATDNLILQNGGVHTRCLHSNEEVIGLLVAPIPAAGYVIGDALDGGSIYHTHIIDMHAVDTCHNGRATGDINTMFGDHNCGPAGEFAEVGFNTILYTAGNGIHLRGTPAVEMWVHDNVFAHKNHGSLGLSTGAMVQNETGLRDTNNRLDVNLFNTRKTCDFDGDDTSDDFIATGVAWWYASSALGGRWVFLNRSPILVPNVDLTDVDKDGRCDVIAGGQVFFNRDPQPLARSPGEITSSVSAPISLSLQASGGTRPYSWSVAGLPGGLTATPTGQISGTPAADGPTTSAVTATVTAANGLRSSVIFNWTLTTHIPDLRGRDQGDVQSVLTPAGLRLGDVNLVYDCTDPPGGVLGQTPPAGQAVPVRSSVSISVASLTDGRGHRCRLN